MKLTDIHPSLVKAIECNLDIITNGNFLCIDPSSGSAPNKRKGWTGSMPGYAIYRKGKLYKAGQITVPAKLLKGINYCPHRLQYIARRLQRKFPKAFSLLVIETFHWKTNRGTNQQSFQQLNMSVGAIVAALKWKQMIGVLAYEWAKHRDRDGKHVKGDLTDAIAIGQFIVDVAQLIQESK